MNLPIHFHDICTIYPFTVSDAIHYFEKGTSTEMFLPFLLTKDIINAPFRQYSLYQIVLSDSKLFQSFSETLRFLCRTENIKINPKTLDITIDNNPGYLNSAAFDELSDIISTMVCMEKIHKTEKQIPKFETPEGYERWKKLQNQREKNHTADDEIHIYDIINCVQFGGNYYIPDEEILKWSYWKLIHASKTISLLKNYDFTCNAYLQCGDKALIEKHWSELIKL